MRTLRVYVLVVAIHLFGCESPTFACDDDFFRAPAVLPAGFRDATADFYAQLPSGHIVLTGSVFVDSLEFADHVTASHVIVINCVGGWNCQLRGKFTLRKTTDWQLLWTGVTLHQASFHAEYMQASRFTGVFIHESSFTADHSTDVSFRDAYIQTTDITLNDAGQVLFDGGYVGSSRLSYTGTTGVNGWAGPVAVTRMHVEHSQIGVRQAQSFEFTGNGLINAHVTTDARKQNIAHNDWVRSTLNGRRMGCT